MSTSAETARNAKQSHVYALLIGIEYTTYARQRKAEQLPGCSRDTENIYRYLVSETQKVPNQNVSILVDAGSLKRQRGTKEPTKQNICDGFKWLVGKANEAGSEPCTLYVHYSGHGSWERDRSGDEQDGRDESLVPADYLDRGCIIDDYLRANFINKLPSNCTLVCIFDCCHSGTVLDLPLLWEPTKQHYAASKKCDEPQCNVVCISGCMDTQTSASAYDIERRRQWQGAMTWALLQSVRPKRTRSRLRPGRKHVETQTQTTDVISSVRQLLKSKRFQQYPQVSCSSRQCDPTTLLAKYLK